MDHCIQSQHPNNLGVHSNRTSRTPTSQANGDFISFYFWRVESEILFNQRLKSLPNTICTSSGTDSIKKINKQKGLRFKSLAKKIMKEISYKNYGAIYIF